MAADPIDVVRGFHEAMQARDWAAAAGLLADDVTVWWPVTGERFHGAAFLAMQQAYPEGWRIHVIELVADGPRVAGRIAVDQDGHRFWDHGCWTVVDGRITDAVELWATEGAEPPPAWRAVFTS